MIVYDDYPILATDPWFGDEDAAYFGSWTLSHKIPIREKQDILDSKYLWFSHGHPDHLNPSSIQRLRGKTILLPDHVGSRIARALMEDDFEVHILPDREWINLSKNVEIMCITTSIQDSILLISVNGRLFINLNDAGTRNSTRFIRRVSSNFKDTYLLSLSGYGDADMINFFDSQGNTIIPPAKHNIHVGEQLGLLATSLGANAVIPFSSHHQYQRTDSIWAQEYVTPLYAYHTGLPDQIDFIPPFTSIDCESREYVELSPEKLTVNPKPPEYFGDNWSDELEPEDRTDLDHYFLKKELVRKRFGFIEFLVGGKTHTIGLNPKSTKGITFEVPRNSLMSAITAEVFDDLLIGNFMKTTLHNMRTLYDLDFNFLVTKYGDNGRAQTESEVNEYLTEYRRRAGREFLYDTFLDYSKSILNRILTDRSSRLRRKLRSFYYHIR